MILLKNITKTYGDKAVLTDFSFEFKAGRRYCLFGPSGCGKTTLLNIIAGIVKPESGSVENTEKTRFVFQESRLLEWRTVIENVCIERGRADRETALELLRVRGLDSEADSYPSALSGGMRRCVSIARALLAEPTLLLLDEPTNGLDEVAAQDMLRLIEQRMQGGTVIMVTHDRELADNVCDEIIEL